MARDGLPLVEPSEARAIVRALRAGSAPDSPLTRWLTVGDAVILDEFELDLTQAAGGGFRSTLLVGDAGAGKSHLLTTMRYAAMQQDFITSLFANDPAAKLLFNRPDQIYQSIIERMRLPADPEGREDAFRLVLATWTEEALSRLRGVPRSTSMLRRLAAAGLTPAFDKIPRRTRFTLAAYIMASEQRDAEVRDAFEEALRGRGMPNRELIQLAQRLRLDPEWIGYTPPSGDAGYYFGLLRVVCCMARAVGHAGLVLLFDEAIATSELPTRSRRKAFTVLGSLLFHEHHLSGAYVAAAFLPEYGLKLDQEDRYTLPPDLWRGWLAYRRERVRELERPTACELTQLRRRIAALHGIAFGWDAIGTVGAQAEPCDRRRPSEPVRALVRRWVAALDAQRPDGP